MVVSMIKVGDLIKFQIDTSQIYRIERIEGHMVTGLSMYKDEKDPHLHGTRYNSEYGYFQLTDIGTKIILYRRKGGKSHFPEWW